MIRLFPAIDILDGRAVRLYQGRRDRVTDYGTPAVAAGRWRDGGAQWLHVVDLNGAFDGTARNDRAIREIVAATGLRVQVGGGIRSLAAIRAYLDAGVERVILGTVVYSDRALLRDAVRQFGAERVVCGLDARDGRIAIKGWVERVDLTPAALGSELYESGVRTVVYTDISRDGALTGVNVGACAELAARTGLNVIASGGLRDLDDVRACARAGLYGAILGKALYEGRVTVADALRAAEEESC